MVELFRRNNQQLLAFNYFRKNFIIVVWRGSKYNFLYMIAKSNMQTKKHCVFCTFYAVRTIAFGAYMALHLKTNVLEAFLYKIYKLMKYNLWKIWRLFLKELKLGCFENLIA